MKKVLTILIGMVLVFSMVCGVSATEITAASTDKSATTTVSFSVDESYTVTIPATITIDPNNGMGNGDIKVTLYRIDPTKSLNVTIYDSDGSYESVKKQWVMKHTSEDDDTSIYYLVGKGSSHIVENDANSESPVKPETVVLSVPSGTVGEISEKIHCKIPAYSVASINHSGTYTSQLKFTVAIVSTPSSGA